MARKKQEQSPAQGVATLQHIDVHPFYDKVKQEHPNTIVLFNIDKRYVAYNEDATKIAPIVGDRGTLKQNTAEKTATISFPAKDINAVLSQLVQAGNRVALADPIGMGKMNTQEKTVEPQKEEKKQQEGEKKSVTVKTPASSTGFSEVDVMSLLTELKVKGSAKLSDHAKPVEPEPIKTVRDPQMVTVNGDVVTHGHVFQSNKNQEDWLFSARINNVPMKPQFISQEDLVAFRNKEVTVPEMMEKYYPSKIAPKVSVDSYKLPREIETPEGMKTLSRLNVFKSIAESPDQAQKPYLLYAVLDDKKMITPASKELLNAWFDRTMTPAQIVEKGFGERLGFKSAYDKYQLPDNVKDVRITKDANGAWTISANVGDQRTNKVEVPWEDRKALFEHKSVTKEQLAAKHLDKEISRLSAPELKQSSLKI